MEAQLAMWADHQFPPSASAPSATVEDERVFSLERDTASRSRHKALDEFSTGAFFGNFGAALAHPQAPQGAMHERSKYLQLQQHLGLHGDMNGTSNPADGFLFPYTPDLSLGLNPTLVDPFLTPAKIAIGGYSNDALPPLTIRDPRDPVGRQSSDGPQSFGMQTIDPATTTLGQPHRVTIPLRTMAAATSRLKVKFPAPGNIIPVDHDFVSPHPAAAASNAAHGEDVMDHDLDDFDDLDLSPNASVYGNPTDLYPLGPTPTSDGPSQPTTYSAAEDKRRRNTAASARFRRKKKEREAEMVRRTKELGERVTALEKECENLIKQNDLLRQLVLNGFPVASSPSFPSSIPNPNLVSAPTSAAANEVELDVNSNTLNAAAGIPLIEELVRLLKVNSAILTGASAPPAPTPAGPSGRTTSGKRKRGSAT